MANNQYVNKVVYNNSTLIDLTEDTVTPETLLNGYTAHDRTGGLINGTVVIPTKVSELENDAGYISSSGIVDLTVVPVEIAGVDLPDGTSSQANLDVFLGNYVPAGKTIFAISNVRIGVYPMPYIEGGGTAGTYVMLLNTTNKFIRITNRMAAWGGTLRCILYCV